MHDVLLLTIAGAGLVCPLGYAMTTLITVRSKTVYPWLRLVEASAAPHGGHR